MEASAFMDQTVSLEYQFGRPLRWWLNRCASKTLENDSCIDQEVGKTMAEHLPYLDIISR